jgi:hypothetical protein
MICLFLFLIYLHYLVNVEQLQLIFVYWLFENYY